MIPDKILKLLFKDNVAKEFYLKFFDNNSDTIKYESGRINRSRLLGIYTVRDQVNNDQKKQIVGMKSLIKKLEETQYETLIGYEIKIDTHEITLVTDEGGEELLGAIYIVNGKVLTEPYDNKEK